VQAQPTTDRIVTDPEVLRGKPIIRGTRISVDLILSFLDGGQTPEEIVDDFPNLSLADILAAVEYAAAHAGPKLRAT
jgi:uncharacterized protein (DUF433 family)